MVIVYALKVVLVAEPDKNPPAPPPPPTGRWLVPLAGQPLRVALWGDSHLAAGFFSQELARVLGLTPEQVQAARWPATVGRAGVRLPLRKSCASVSGRCWNPGKSSP